MVTVWRSTSTAATAMAIIFTATMTASLSASKVFIYRLLEVFLSIMSYFTAALILPISGTTFGVV